MRVQDCSLTYFLLVAILISSFLSSAHAKELNSCQPGNMLAGVNPDVSYYIQNVGRITDGKFAKEGKAWNSPFSAVFLNRNASLIYDLGRPVSLRMLALQGDNNDEYVLHASLDKKRWNLLRRFYPITKPGLRLRYTKDIDQLVRYIMVTGDEGDGYYSISELQAYCMVPEEWLATVASISSLKTESPQKTESFYLPTKIVLAWAFLFGLFLFGSIIFWGARRKHENSPDRPLSSYGRSLILHFQQIYLSVDPRSLGLFRIIFGGLLLYDLARRVPDMEVWYTNQGLLPSYLLNLEQMDQGVASFFYLAFNVFETSIGFLFCGFVYFMFMVGWKTRLFQVLACLCVISLQQRIAFLENGGDVVIRLMAIWTLFLPLGVRYSLDSLLTKHAFSNGESTKNQGQSGINPMLQPVVSFAVLGILLQLAAIYLFNALHKYGSSWEEGVTVHYALHLEQMVTPLGYAIREYIPLWLIRTLTWGVLGFEGLIPFLLLTPVATWQARRLAVIGLTIMHSSFALLLNLGVFSPALISSYALLLSSRDWADLERWQGFRKKIAHPFQERIRNFVVVLEPRKRKEDKRGVRWIKELCVLVLIGIFVIQTNHQSFIIPATMKIDSPPLVQKFVQKVVTYLGFWQGWIMFAPEGPSGEIMIVVEAMTVDGRKIDPINYASRGTDQVIIGPGIPGRLGLNEFWTNYLSRIVEHATHHKPLRNWILDYHKRTGRPEDLIVEFKAYKITQIGPKPGTTEMFSVTKREFLRYP